LNEHGRPATPSPPSVGRENPSVERERACLCSRLQVPPRSGGTSRLQQPSTVRPANFHDECGDTIQVGRGSASPCKSCRRLRGIADSGGVAAPVPAHVGGEELRWQIADRGSITN
jgi:hypothetical protein